MSITDLAAKAGLDRSVVSRAEQREKDGNITIKQIDKIAEAMGGKLVYAIIPKEGRVEDLVMEQARKKASRVVRRTRAHMALEAQSEGLQSQEDAIEELASEMAREMARGFWR
jgi:predicted DNA-binding mobile mystery protein A